jgi:hypothetical protein
MKGGEMKVPAEDTFKNIYQATEYLVRGNLPRELFRTCGEICLTPNPKLNPESKVYCVYRRQRSGNARPLRRAGQRRGRRRAIRVAHRADDRYCSRTPDTAPRLC